MARDSTGNWSNPDTLTAGTPARASDVNALINDLGAEITDSLSRSGKGGMNAQLKINPGTATVPGLAPSGASNTGIFGKSGNKLAVTANGSEVIEASSSAVTITCNGSQVAEFSSSGLAVVPDNWVQLADIQKISHGKVLGRSSTSAGNVEQIAFAYGQCILSKSGSNLLLDQRKGNRLYINGNIETVPYGGVTLAPTGLAASTLYYIYAYMNGSTLTLEASTTANSTGTDGTQVKFGDSSRTFVGIARTTSASAFSDTITKRFVRSFFNDPGVVLSNGFTAARTTNSGTFVELNTEIRCEFITFGGEMVEFSSDGYVSIDTGNALAFTAIGIDSTTPLEGLSGGQAYNPTANIPFAVSVRTSSLTVGYHFATLLGKVSAGTSQWQSNSINPGDRVSLKGSIRS